MLSSSTSNIVSLNIHTPPCGTQVLGLVFRRQACPAERKKVSLPYSKTGPCHHTNQGSKCHNKSGALCYDNTCLPAWMRSCWRTCGLHWHPCCVANRSWPTPEHKPYVLITNTKQCHITHGHTTRGPPAAHHTAPEGPVLAVLLGRHSEGRAVTNMAD